MSIATNVKTLPRAATGLYLRALRLPLTAAERIAGDRVDEAWAPSVAFDALEAKIETGLGVLLRDDDLLDSAQTRRERVAKLRKAAALETVASEQREDATEEFQARRQTAEEKREEAARRAKQREADLERNAELHEQKVQQKAAKKTAAAKRTKAKQDEVINRQERTAKVEALDAEAKALETVKAAVEADEKLEIVADSLEGQKEDRKTG
jgi:hypothetical protein